MSKKMKIAYVATPITFGGTEKVNLNFLKYVNRDQFAIEPILFLRPWESEKIFESELKKLGFKHYSISVAKSTNPELFRVLRCLFDLLKVIRGNSYDLIHTHGYLADLLGVLVSKICKIPIISTCHGFIYEGSKLTFYNNLDCFALKHFDKIISVSDPLKYDLINKKISKDKITVIENTPDSNHGKNDISESRNQLRNNIRVESSDILIGFIGRLSSEKGLKYLLEAIKLLGNSPQSFKLVLIGEGPQEVELRAMVDDNGLTSVVVFAGFQKNIDEWLTAIDIFVLPSLTEGTPMVLLEAMAHGVPCIATSVGGIPQVIESGIDGILVQPAKPEEISNAVSGLATDLLKREKLTTNARNKIRNQYNIKDWAVKIENEYINVANSSYKSKYSTSNVSAL